MNRKAHLKLFSISQLLLLVFLFFSIGRPASEFAWAQAEQTNFLPSQEGNVLREALQVNLQKAHTYKTAERYMLIPGGDAIGIKIQTDGLVVVDTYQVPTHGGEVNPAKEAGVLKGDIITAVNHQKILTVEEYKTQLRLAESGSSLQLEVNRQGTVLNLEVNPVTSSDGHLTTGLFLRDKLAGIGTLTYIDPASHKYGALGHEIVDQDTGQLVKIHQGEIIDSDVTSVRKARSGTPGEKIADIHFDCRYGSLEKNNCFGIYGVMETSQFDQKELLPIAYISEVRKGEAQILTVLDGDKIEAFTINITEVNNQSQKAIKGIKYMVTDERLLNETGGIVQGMSGSPIIQDGKIIGAVTHVLVHDSTLGYGIFIEWMLQESGVNYLSQKYRAA